MVSAMVQVQYRCRVTRGSASAIDGGPVVYVRVDQACRLTDAQVSRDRAGVANAGGTASDIGGRRGRGLGLLQSHPPNLAIIYMRIILIH